MIVLDGQPKDVTSRRTPLYGPTLHISYIQFTTHHDLVNLWDDRIINHDLARTFVIVASVASASS